MKCPKRSYLSLVQCLIVGCITVLIHLSTHAETFPDGRVLEAKFHHLGDNLVDLWPEVPAQPEGTRLDIKFEAKRNAKDCTLTLTIWDVNHTASIEINGKKVDDLAPAQLRKDVYANIPAGSLRDGQNILSIIPNPTDNTVFGNIVLHEKPFRELKKLQTVTLCVIDAATRRSVPARITITDQKGALKEIFFPAPKKKSAVRSGLIYIAGETTIELVEGDYVFYATRGMEWGLDKQMVSVRQPTKVKLKLRREVDTKGFIAADTHIHTVTFSGHGDASIHERMVTLAAEGVEMAVATDHNHNIDYTPFQKELGLNRYFTPVVGNEVTTKVGHFNAFPLKADDSVPNQKETNWVKLVEDIRIHDAKVIVLNHPRWSSMDAYAHQGLNSVTGERASGVPIGFDAMELANSCAMLTDRMRLVDDWFALLNYGETIRAMGSSDTHTVNSPVGQGRTYIRSSTDDASRINVHKACDTILQGDTSVSLGIFADVVVNQRSTMGDIARVNGSEVNVRLRVASPSWLHPEKVLIYLNGAVVAERTITGQTGKPFNQFVSFTLPAPKHDAHLVCVVFGPGIKEPYWRTDRDYTMAATNPVFLDADGDGKYRSPRETAQILLSQTAKNLDAQWRAANAADDGIGVQMLDLVYKSVTPEDRAELVNRLKLSDRKRFKAYLDTLKVEQSKTAAVR